METLEVIRRPLITEKGTAVLQKQRKYAFEVAPWANKPLVKKAVEAGFNVKVAGVRIINIPGKSKRFGRSRYQTPPQKKAVVTLKEGFKIEFFEGA